MASLIDYVRDVLILATHEKKKNREASKSNLTVVAALATILLISVVVAVSGPVGSQPVWAGTFPGVNGKIAFVSDRDPQGIYVMNADGSEQTRLGEGYDPNWSPDGSKIAFTKEAENDPGEIFVMNADGSEQTRLTNTAFNNDPTWSPDGSKIVFSESDAIAVMNADGSEKTTLGLGSDPSWSPDGTKIVFLGSLPDNSVPFNPNRQHTQIFVMNADGSEQTRLTNNSASDTTPAWGPATMTPEPSPKQSTLTINSVDLSGNTISEAWTAIRNATNGMVIDTGFTPLTFIGDSSSEYKVSVANYDGRIFSSWKDDAAITSNSRVISLASDIELTATFDLGDSLRGFTSFTYAGTEEQQHDLTVNAFSLDDNRTLHMWTIVDPQSSDALAGTTTYKVYASNYKDRVFDHWEDGSTDRIRTVTIDGATTITAYYKTG
jgi:dipeptidyl aminopeptidase/acylaminoacyl peptidase